LLGGQLLWHPRRVPVVRGIECGAAAEGVEEEVVAGRDDDE
jgi:hypothetical protein